jgi:hypothetical protein
MQIILEPCVAPATGQKQKLHPQPGGQTNASAKRDTCRHFGGDFATRMQQGDGWRGFQVFSFKSGNGNAARGIVLSNSCDVSAETARALPPKVTFAPIVKLARIIGRIGAHGLLAVRAELPDQAAG